MENIVVFLDYSNVHLVRNDPLREIFEKLDHTCFARPSCRIHLTKHTKECELAAIFLYRGSPERFLDPQATKIFRDEQQRWGSDPLVHATYLVLPHAKNRVKPKEAGVDVRLSLDVVKTAEAHRYATLFLFSGDCDCFPRCAGRRQDHDPFGNWQLVRR